MVFAQFPLQVAGANTPETIPCTVTRRTMRQTDITQPIFQFDRQHRVTGMNINVPTGDVERGRLVYLSVSFDRDAALAMSSRLSTITDDAQRRSAFSIWLNQINFSILSNPHATTVPLPILPSSPQIITTSTPPVVAQQPMLPIPSRVGDPRVRSALDAFLQMNVNPFLASETRLTNDQAREVLLGAFREITAGHTRELSNAFRLFSTGREMPHDDEGRLLMLREFLRFAASPETSAFRFDLPVLWRDLSIQNPDGFHLPVGPSHEMVAALAVLGWRLASVNSFRRIGGWSSRITTSDDIIHAIEWPTGAFAIFRAGPQGLDDRQMRQILLQEYTRIVRGQFEGISSDYSDFLRSLSNPPMLTNDDQRITRLREFVIYLRNQQNRPYDRDLDLLGQDLGASTLQPSASLHLLAAQLAAINWRHHHLLDVGGQMVPYGGWLPSRTNAPLRSSTEVTPADFVYLRVSLPFYGFNADESRRITEMLGTIPPQTVSLSSIWDALQGSTPRDSFLRYLTSITALNSNSSHRELIAALRSVAPGPPPRPVTTRPGEENEDPLTGAPSDVFGPEPPTQQPATGTQQPAPRRGSEATEGTRPIGIQPSPVPVRSPTPARMAVRDLEGLAAQISRIDRTFFHVEDTDARGVAIGRARYALLISALNTLGLAPSENFRSEITRSRTGGLGILLDALVARSAQAGVDPSAGATLARLQRIYRLEQEVSALEREVNTLAQRATGGTATPVVGGALVQQGGTLLNESGPARAALLARIQAKTSEIRSMRGLTAGDRAPLLSELETQSALLNGLRVAPRVVPGRSPASGTQHPAPGTQQPAPRSPEVVQPPINVGPLTDDDLYARTSTPGAVDNPFPIASGPGSLSISADLVHGSVPFYAGHAYPAEQVQHVEPNPTQPSLIRGDGSVQDPFLFTIPVYANPGQSEFARYAPGAMIYASPSFNLASGSSTPVRAQFVYVYAGIGASPQLSTRSRLVSAPEGQRHRALAEELIYAARNASAGALSGPVRSFFVHSEISSTPFTTFEQSMVERMRLASVHIAHARSRELASLFGPLSAAPPTFAAPRVDTHVSPRLTGVGGGTQASPYVVDVRLDTPPTPESPNGLREGTALLTPPIQYPHTVTLSGGARTTVYYTLNVVASGRPLPRGTYISRRELVSSTNLAMMPPLSTLARTNNIPTIERPSVIESLGFAIDRASYFRNVVRAP